MHFLGAACPCNNNSLRSFKWIVHIHPPKANRKQHQASQLLCYLHAALALGQTLLLVWSTICRRDGAKQLYLLGGMSSYVTWISRVKKIGCFFVGMQIRMFLTRHTVDGSEIRWTTLLFRKPIFNSWDILCISTGGFLPWKHPTKGENGWWVFHMIFFNVHPENFGEDGFPFWLAHIFDQTSN